MTTLAERLAAGLRAHGWFEIPNRTRKYRAFRRHDKQGIMFIGVNGALRYGRNASSSYSLGDPSHETEAYHRYLTAGDSALALCNPTAIRQRIHAHEGENK